jgi:hypothetical protein
MLPRIEVTPVPLSPTRRKMSCALESCFANDASTAID